MTCQGTHCVCDGALEHSRRSEVEVEVEVGQSIGTIFFGNSRMERGLLHETTLALKSDKCHTLIGDSFKQRWAAPHLFVHPAAQKDEFG